MKSKDKLNIIQEKIELINNKILKGKSYQFKFDNKGANCYCVVIIKANKELHCSQFGTFDNVINSLDLLIETFRIGYKEREER